MLGKIEKTMREVELGDPIWREFEQKIDGMGVRGFLFDVDDFFLDTYEVFRWGQENFLRGVSELTGESMENLWIRARTINNDARNIYQVNPFKWAYFSGRMAGELTGDTRKFDDLMPSLKAIYQRPPEWLPGALSLAQGIRKLGKYRVCLVTHANVPWTEWKLNQTGLINYTDALVVADQNGLKTPWHWYRGARAIGLSVDQLIGAGDNIHADLEPLLEIGVRAVIGVKSPLPYVRDVVPDGAWVANSTTEWLRTVIDQAS